VPVLVGALERPALDLPPAVESAVEALERVLALPGKTLVVCACDLSSADGEASAAETPHEIRERDRLAMDHATRADADGYWREVSKSGDPAQSAGLIAPYLFLRTCAGRPSADPERGSITGSVLGYQQLPPMESLATAASVLFH
jgi:hypothetical protein